jgi:hypothetical protein
LGATDEVFSNHISSRWTHHHTGTRSNK